MDISGTKLRSSNWLLTHNFLYILEGFLQSTVIQQFLLPLYLTSPHKYFQYKNKFRKEEDHLSLSLSLLCLTFSLSLYFSVCLSLALSLSLSRSLSLSLSLSLSIYLSIYLSDYLFIYPAIFSSFYPHFLQIDFIFHCNRQFHFCKEFEIISQMS